MKKILIIFLLTFFILAPAGLVSAQTYTLETPLLGSKTTVSGPAEYINMFFVYGLGLVGVMALAAVVFGGTIYLLAGDSENRKSKGKEWIWGGISGLILLICSFLILYTINPQLVSLNEPGFMKIEIPPPTPSAWTTINPQTGLQVGPPVTYGLGSISTIKFAQADDKQLFEQHAPPALNNALSGLPVPVTISEFNNYSGHVSGSLHYQNLAVDIWVGNLTNEQIGQVMQYLSSLPQTDELFYAGYPQYNMNDGKPYNGPSTYTHTGHIHFGVKSQ